MRSGESENGFRAIVAMLALAIALANVMVPARADATELFFAGFETKARDGYDASISVAIRGKERKAAGSLSLSRDLRRKTGRGGSRGYVLADYKTPRATARWRGMAMELGELGNIDLSFHPHSIKVRKRLGIGCRYERARIVRGKFRGSAVFEGERAYSGFELSRVRGVVGRIVVRGCNGRFRAGNWAQRSGRRIPSDRSYYVHSDGPVGTDVTSFSAQKTSHGRRSVDVMFGAEMARKFAGSPVRVEKQISLRAPRRRFTVAGARAILTPPRPFLGAARVEDREMNGDLRVLFPGEEAMALTPAKAKFLAARSIAGSK